MQKSWSSFRGRAAPCSFSDFVDDLTKGRSSKPDYCFKTDQSQNNQSEGNSGSGNAYGQSK